MITLRHEMLLSGLLSPLIVMLCSACGEPAPERGVACGGAAASVFVVVGDDMQVAVPEDLEVVEGDLLLCQSMAFIELPRLRSISGGLTVIAFGDHGFIDFPALESVGGDIYGENATTNFPLLESARGVVVRSVLRESLELPRLTRVATLESTGPTVAPLLVAANTVNTGPLVAPALRRFNEGRISPFAEADLATDLPSLDNALHLQIDLTGSSTSVELPALRELDALFLKNYGEASGRAEVFRAPQLTNVDQIVIESQPNLKSLDLPLLQRVEFIDATNNPALRHCDLELLAQRTGAQLTSSGNDSAVCE